MYNLIHGDCLTELPKIEKESIDLIIADIPYNVTKNEWDKFDSQLNYIDFLSFVFLEYQRVLKNSGSLYVFHNNFEQICEIQNLFRNNTNFVFRNLIVWNKKFDGSNYEWRKNKSLQKENLKNYQKYVEYILFYTFEDYTQSEMIHTNKENFSEYKNYIQTLLDRKNLTYNSDIIVRTLFEQIGYKSMQSARSISQRLFNLNYKAFGVLTRKQYDVLKDVLGFDIFYEELYNLYINGKLKATDISKKYTFNNLGTHHSVWNYNNVQSGSMIHPTEKPIDLLENIIKHSSNEGDLVLDSFVGSGSTGIACINTNRDFIGIELDYKYYNDAKNRLQEAEK